MKIGWVWCGSISNALALILAVRDGAYKGGVGLMEYSEADSTFQKGVEAKRQKAAQHELNTRRRTELE